MPVAAAGAAASTPKPAVAAAVDLVPHRAAYRLSLAGSERSAHLVEADGVLGIEWRAGCDGWLSQQLLAFTAFSDEGEELSYDIRFKSWESRDNDRMRFSVRRFDDAGGLAEEYRGEAVLDDDGPAAGSGGVARFTSPETRTVELPPGTIFPTEHMQSILASARSGEPLVSHEVFDGSGFDALTRVTTAIGRPRGDDDGDGAGDGGDAGRSWPVSMAYHGAAGADGEGTGLPEFEAALVVDDGGVLRKLTLDYGEFQLSAELERLEELPPPAGCRR